MDIRQKLLIGALGLKELHAKMDIEILNIMHNEKKGAPEDEIHEALKVQKTIDYLLELTSDPLIDVSPTVITNSKKE